MRLRRGIAVSLLAIAQSTLFAPRAAAQSSPPTQPTVAAVAAPASRINVGGMSRLELQRKLADLDERRRWLRSVIEPADSVLRLFSADTARLSAATRPPELAQDSVRVRQLFLAHRQNPASRELRTQLADAIEATANSFASVEQSLSSRVTTPDIARDFLERSPYAAVVPFPRARPPADTWLAAEAAVVDSIPIARARLGEFFASLSDSSYAAYRAKVLDAYAARMGDVRLLSKSDRDEVVLLQQDAAVIANELGKREDLQAKLDGRMITIGLPVVAGGIVLLLLAPLLYRNEELRRAILSSGLLFEVATVFLVTSAVIILGIAGRISTVMIGIVLGVLSGYVLGRSVNPLSSRN